MKNKILEVENEIKKIQKWLDKQNPYIEITVTAETIQVKETIYGQMFRLDKNTI